MKFNFIWIGKTRDANFKALQDRYLQRLSRFVDCEITEIKDLDEPNPDREGKRILSKVNHSTFVCLLDVDGKKLSSVQLATEMEHLRDRGIKQIGFVVGGAEGSSSEVAERADYTLSLSFLTFTHEMARVVLLEQLYRAFTIIKGFPYQK
jgi:23S rRNA (pseudouridine1915-N3)-methyltransferase